MELKARHVVYVYDDYSEHPCEERSQVYLKSEADKVIAEMKKACTSKDEWCLHTLKENRHHKYKRCLAMAYIEWLKQMTLCYYPQSILYRRAYRRERKWKELAEKFKEAK